MGYTTRFKGQFDLSRALTALERATIRGSDFPAFPDFYCQWIPNDDGTAIIWDRGEKFYEYVPWMNLIIDRYLTPWKISASGCVEYQGEAIGDYGHLVVKNGHVVQVEASKTATDLRSDIQLYIDELDRYENDVASEDVVERLRAILGRHA